MTYSTLDVEQNDSHLLAFILNKLVLRINVFIPVFMDLPDEKYLNH